MSVHQRRIQRPSQGQRHPDQHEWQGCWRDNVVERLWRSIKYEEVYHKAYDSVSVAKSGLGNYIQFYNTRRPHLLLVGV